MLRPPLIAECRDDAAATTDAAPMPTLAEIVRQRELAGRPVSLLELETEGAGGVAWPVTLEHRTLRGMPMTLIVAAGDDFFDYLPLPLPAGRDLGGVLPALRAVAASVGADGVLLPHCVAPWPADSGRWRREFANRCFDVGLATKGWDALARKESLRRHRNRARKVLDYCVEHLHGPLPETLGATIAALHRERWAFDGVVSPFADPRRVASYAAVSDRLLTTVLRDGDSVLAAHVGMRFGGTLIWHTPVINLRYLACSPLEILLLETVEECARLGVKVLDYGLGDEAYKDRFSNASRPVADLFLPASVRGWVVHCQFRLSLLAGWRARLSALRQWLSERYPRADERRLCSPDGWPSAAATDPDIEAVAEFARLVDLFRSAGWAPRRRHFELLRRGAVFLYREGGGLPAGLWLSRDPAGNAAGAPGLALAGGRLHQPLGSDTALLHLLAGVRHPVPVTLNLPADRADLAAALKRLGWR